MQTDDNGYRLLVRALAAGTGESSQDDAARRAQLYEKLGLDPATKPTLKYKEPYVFLSEYREQQGLDDKEFDDLSQRIDEPWTLQELPMLKPWLEQNSAALDLLGEAVRKPAFCCPLVRLNENASLLEISFDELQRVRSLARGLSARANYRVGTGDIDGAISDVVTCVRLGRYEGYQGTIISHLVGIAVESIANAVAIAGNGDVQPTQAQWQQLAHDLAAAPPRRGIRETLQAERYVSLDSVQSLASGGSAEVLAQEDPRFRIVSFVALDWNVVMRRLNELFDDPDQAMELRPATRPTFSDLFLGSRSRHVADILVALLFPAVQACDEAQHRMECIDHLHRMTVAMLQYAGDHGTLPPAYTVDETGKPLHSWRVLLLPYLGQQQLYDQLRLDEPWDSPHNQQFHDKTPQVYRCPSATLQPDQTTYSVVVGSNTPFDADGGKPLSDFGMHLLLVAERQQPVGWMEPAAEVTFDAAKNGINPDDAAAGGLGSPHPGGMVAGFRDGSVRFLSSNIAKNDLEALLNGTANEPMDW